MIKLNRIVIRSTPRIKNEFELNRLKIELAQKIGCKTSDISFNWELMAEPPADFVFKNGI